MPPSRKGREYELRALGLRDFAGLTSPRQRLDPFELARYAGLLVATFDQVASLLTQETRDHLTGAGRNDWSGGACSQTLPDGTKLIILNPTHGANRQNATLMEEISHVFLGHTPSRLAVKNSAGDGAPRARDYDAKIEEQAYSVGASALVPFEGLREMVGAGMSSREIARHYGVSRHLVEFRIKTTHLWSVYLEEQASRNYAGK
ncbi:MAG: ImmA/IrrE family metallo-endopeptidase [Acidobacteriota bacterium]|nr:ImmA/IrrE family metallo-endopeptidase [Acidobacteriota bacterium]MDH3528452.1 ImmA/IrrE family metallo-endopeptidase [Acidobacteriota bacterium]